MSAASAPREGLRLVVFDETDTPLNHVRHDGRRGTAHVRIGLSPAWWVGARLHAIARRSQGAPFLSRGVRSWREALRWASEASRRERRPIAELQVWGHGGWGFMELGGGRLDREALSRSSELASELDALRDTLGERALVWLRCCSAFGGREGRLFAPAIAERLRARVAAHTYLIGPFQSGTHAVAPSEAPDWPLEEGVEMRDGEPVAARWSGPREPRTVGCLRLDLPEGW